MYARKINVSCNFFLKKQAKCFLTFCKINIYGCKKIALTAISSRHFTPYINKGIPIRLMKNTDWCGGGGASDGHGGDPDASFSLSSVPGACSASISSSYTACPTFSPHFPSGVRPCALPVSTCWNHMNTTWPKSHTYRPII